QLSYEITQGDSLTVTATAPGSPTSLSWIFTRADGTQFTQTVANGASVTYSWSDLEKMGVEDVGTYPSAGMTTPALKASDDTLQISGGVSAITSSTESFSTDFSIKVDIAQATGVLTNSGIVGGNNVGVNQGATTATVSFISVNDVAPDDLNG